MQDNANTETHEKTPQDGNRNATKQHIRDIVTRIMGERKAHYTAKEAEDFIASLLHVMTPIQVRYAHRKIEFCHSRKELLKKHPQRAAHGILCRRFNIDRRDIKRYCEPCENPELDNI